MTQKLGITIRNRLYQRDYRDKYPEKLLLYRKDNNERGKEWRRNNRLKVITHYTNGTMKCQCSKCDCGVYEFLSVEHLNGNDRKHRKEITGDLNNWLIKNNFPEGFTILCHNCNQGKRMNSGVCPHFNQP